MQCKLPRASLCCDFSPPPWNPSLSEVCCTDSSPQRPVRGALLVQSKNMDGNHLHGCLHSNQLISKTMYKVATHVAKRVARTKQRNPEAKLQGMSLEATSVTFLRIERRRIEGKKGGAGRNTDHGLPEKKYTERRV